MGSKLGAIPGAVRSWYSEIKRGYNYDTGVCCWNRPARIFERGRI